jgi:hypothetical protein
VRISVIVIVMHIYHATTCHVMMLTYLYASAHQPKQAIHYTDRKKYEM